MRWATVGRPLVVLLRIVVVLVLACGAIAVSLWLTPMQTVTAAGQTVRVGATAPSLTLSGPGQLDLFGQSLPTTIEFVGPVRPRLELDQILLTEQLKQFVANGSSAEANALQKALIHGWQQFFTWQVVLVAVVAVILFGALAGWLRRGWRRSAVVILVGLLVAEALNVGAIMATAYTAPDKLGRVTSLADLVGVAPTTPVPARAARRTAISRVAVVGDSTAAGMGNRPLPNATPQDKACQRSRDAFAIDLAQLQDRRVTNLACSGATIRTGLLGPQKARGQTLPPQIDSPAVTEADLIVVSIGANDVNWAVMLQLCAVSNDCGNKAEQALFDQQLALFSKDLLQLVSELQLLPNRPIVIINQYYDPLSGETDCLFEHGLTDAKKQILQGELSTLNDLLAHAAEVAGFRTARPDFSAQGLCSDQPYVQGPSDKAPFHPTPGGQLVIALADEQALHDLPGTTDD